MHCEFFIHLLDIDIHCFPCCHQITKCLEWQVLSKNRDMVFNATFNNISVILWQSVLLVESKNIISYTQSNMSK